MPEKREIFTTRNLIALIISSVVFLSIGAAVASIFLKHSFAAKEDYALKKVSSFSDSTLRIERSVIENVPIYEDYGTPEIEAKLRTFLHEDHMKTALSNGVQIGKDSDIEKMVIDGRLTIIDDSSQFFYFYNVPKKYHFLTPPAKKGLNQLGRLFQEKLESKKAYPKVKIAVSSLIRPDKYQADLKDKNSNAVNESTHSYGVSVDIFIDDYFVSLDEENGQDLSSEIINKIKSRYGYMMGDSLRRQFRSVLTETVLELQDSGKIYAILEKKQRCFHVTFRE